MQSLFGEPAELSIFGVGERRRTVIAKSEVWSQSSLWQIFIFRGGGKPSLPNMKYKWNPSSPREVLSEAFNKCEVQSKEDGGTVPAKSELQVKSTFSVRSFHSDRVGVKKPLLNWAPSCPLKILISADGSGRGDWPTWHCLSRHDHCRTSQILSEKGLREVVPCN